MWGFTPGFWKRISVPLKSVFFLSGFFGCVSCDDEFLVLLGGRLDGDFGGLTGFWVAAECDCVAGGDVGTGFGEGFYVVVFLLELLFECFHGIMSSSFWTIWRLPLTVRSGWFSISFKVFLMSWGTSLRSLISELVWRRAVR